MKDERELRRDAQEMPRALLADEAILDLYWARSEEAIGETDRKYGLYCRKIAFHILFDQPDAEECVNDTWLRAWQAIPPARPAVLRAYLGRITRNLALNRYEKNHAAKRGGGRVEEILDELTECAASRSDVEEQMAAKALAEVINRFLAEQKAETRRIFVRRYWYMDSIGEIAARYGIRESKVKMSLSRTRKRLAARLKEEGYHYG